MRFPEFSGEWDEYAIGEILSIGNGRDYKHLHNGDIPVFGTGGYMTSVDDFLYDGESVFVGRKGTINKPLYYNGKFWTVDTLFYTYNFTDVLPKFVYCLFQTINWLKYNEASGVPSLSKATIEKIKVRIPSMDEQDKLSNLLFLLDKRIEVQNKIIDKLETLIKGIVELAFSHAATSNTLGCYITQISQRNKTGKDLPVLSVSNKHGFVEQSEQFEDRIIASDDTSNYKIVDINDFAYNPARINVGSIARLKDKECGIVSPMYICFRTSKDILPEYLELFFKTVTFSFEVGKRLEGSVRLCLSYESLCEIVIPIISIREQQSLVKMVTTFHSKLDVEKGFLSSYQSQKQCLLSQMFI